MKRVLVALVVVMVAVASTVLPPEPAAAQSRTAEGAVVQLAGSSHLWVVAGGSLHWAGDTRALRGRYVDWNSKYVLSAEQLVQLPIGDPWLSSGLLKVGDAIYFPKWETDMARPEFQHIEKIDTLSIMGITGSNYGRFVLDQAAWERQTGFEVTFGGQPQQPPPAPAKGSFGPRYQGRDPEGCRWSDQFGQELRRHLICAYPGDVVAGWISDTDLTLLYYAVGQDLRITPEGYWYFMDGRTPTPGGNLKTI